MFTCVNVLVTSPENQEKNKRKRAYGLTIDGARKGEKKTLELSTLRTRVPVQSTLPISKKYEPLK